MKKKYEIIQWLRFTGPEIILKENTHIPTTYSCLFLSLATREDILRWEKDTLYNFDEFIEDCHCLKLFEWFPQLKKVVSDDFKNRFPEYLI
jgi:hypothetical protein